MGIAHLVKGEVKVKRSTLMPVEVPKSASKVIVTQKALDKHKAHNSKLPPVRNGDLDFQEVDNIPGTNHFFTVENIKEALESHIHV